MLSSFCNDIYEMLSRRHPNSQIFVIGDEHFYHANIINYTRSQFMDALDMNETIIRKHNEVVGPDDIVIFLGDFAFKKAHIKELNQRLNGHKYLSWVIMMLLIY